MQAYLEFEKQVADLEGKIRELQNMGADGEDAAASVNLDDDIQRLKTKSAQALGDLLHRRPLRLYGPSIDNDLQIRL